MRIKLNWGFGITVFIGLFMTFILTLVFKCSQNKVDLVSSNYYDLEIQYQKQIDRINNSAQLDKQVMITSENGIINFHFPEKFRNLKIEGNITFFKPDNSVHDFKIPLILDPDLSQRISSNEMKSGWWIVKLNYKDEKKEYYAEDKINLN